MWLHINRWMIHVCRWLYLNWLEVILIIPSEADSTVIRHSLVLKNPAMYNKFDIDCSNVGFTYRAREGHLQGVLFTVLPLHVSLFLLLTLNQLHRYHLMTINRCQYHWLILRNVQEPVDEDNRHQNKKRKRSRVASYCSPVNWMSSIRLARVHSI